ncbi:TniQ family protein [Streptomyces sp. SP2-10]|uniref:TniQ family protein n=1 Tax=Streptomyces sp. SP2-10 TaxID=2873385 RepID=UPI00223B3960|nr:TniQ family protein [Streptomyces sp. SP2-10]
MSSPRQTVASGARPSGGVLPGRQRAAAALRRLPVVPAPAPDEAFASWVHRTAVTMGVAPGTAARALGLEYRTSDRAPAYFGILLTPASRHGLAQSAGLSADVVERMHLSRYDGTLLDFEALNPDDDKPAEHTLGTQWLLLSSSRACPHCLATSDVWPLWWRLGIAAVCPVHQCLLIDTCPTCGIALRRGSKNMPGALLRRTQRVLDPKECGNRRPDPAKPRNPDACRQQIADIPTQEVPQALATFQQHALTIADGGAAHLAGKRATGAEWFAAVRFIAAVARLVVHDDELRTLPDFAAQALARVRDARHAGREKFTSGGVPGPGAGPATAAEATAVLALAAPIVDATDRTSGPPYLAAWGSRLTEDRMAGYHKLDPLRRLQRPLVMDEMMAVTVPPARRSRADHARAGATLEFRHIPQRIGVEDYDDFMAVHLPGILPTTGRHIVSLALARLAGAQTWAHASQALGVPTSSRITYRRIAQRTADPEAFWEAVRALAAHMTTRGLIDYEARRTALAGLREVPGRVLLPILQPGGQNLTWQRQRHAAAWLWEHLTGGQAKDAPTYAEGWDGVKEASVAFARGRFHAELPKEAGDALLAWGMQWLASSGIR